MPNNKVVRLVEGRGYRPDGDAGKNYVPPKGAGTGVHMPKVKLTKPVKHVISKEKS